jgi:hypothetical protein
MRRTIRIWRATSRYDKPALIQADQISHSAMTKISEQHVRVKSIG